LPKSLFMMGTHRGPSRRHFAKAMSKAKGKL